MESWFPVSLFVKMEQEIFVYFLYYSFDRMLGIIIFFFCNVHKGYQYVVSLILYQFCASLVFRKNLGRVGLIYSLNVQWSSLVRLSLPVKVFNYKFSSLNRNRTIHLIYFSSNDFW